jgi:hypothetical protein
MVNPFNHSEYIFCKYAGAVEVFDGNGNSVLYAEREGAKKIGKPIHVYTSKYRTNELLTILPPKGRKEILYSFGDYEFPWCLFSPSLEYKVTDTVTGETVGSVVHKSGQIITKDEWILISDGKTVGKLKSRRYFLHSIIRPREYEISASDERVVGEFSQHREMLNFKYTMEIKDRCIDTRLLVAAGIVITILKVSF